MLNPESTTKIDSGKKQVTAIILLKALNITMPFLILGLVCYYFLGTYPADDPWITFRYSRNLVEGYGIVYNPGGEHVEGYTNFLWMIIVAFGLSVKIPPIIVTTIVSIPLVFATGILLHKSFQKIVNKDISQTSGWLPVTILSLIMPYAIWSLAGLETPLTGFLIMALVYSRSTIKNKNARAVAYGAILTLLLLDRTDGAIAVLGLFAFEITEWLAEKPRHLRHLLTRFAIIIAPILFVYFPYFLWRYDYFGYVFPNTYYAKLDGLELWVRIVNGIRYLLSSISGWMLVPMLFAFALPLLNRQALRNPIIRLALILLSLRLGFVLYSGGDVLPYARFLVPSIPLIALLAAYSIAHVFELTTNNRVSRNILAVVVVFFHILGSLETLDQSKLLDDIIEISPLGLEPTLASISEPHCAFCL